MTLLHEPLRAVRLRIAERRRAGQHFGYKPPGRRAERQSPMGVTAGEPNSACARRTAEHRTGIRKARTGAEPSLPSKCLPCKPSLPSKWLRFDRLAEREQFTGRRHQALELHRRRWRIARSKFYAGGQPDALLHRRDAIAILGIEHRTAERRITSRMEMARSVE